jgi:hypothetical protein
MKTFRQSINFELRTAFGNRRYCGRRFTMLMFYLPIIIFEAMLPSPKRDADEPPAVEQRDERPPSANRL